VLGRSGIERNGGRFAWPPLRDHVGDGLPASAAARARPAARGDLVDARGAVGDELADGTVGDAATETDDHR
jgi:hypothetical protein